MSIRALLAVIVLAALPVLHAEDAGLGGKWATQSGNSASVLNGVSLSAGCAGNPRGPGIFRGQIGTPGMPGTPCNDTGASMPIRRPRPAELNLNVDAVNGTVAGSVVLPSSGLPLGLGGPDCGKLKIEEGRVTGRSLSFTTYRTVNGSRIPARWLGEVSTTGALTIRTFDTLPCDTGNGGLSPLTGRPLSLADQSSGDRMLVFRRGNADSRQVGPAGRWWTTDSGVVTALNLKVGDKGKVGGSVNVCGRSELKIEEGSSVGNTVTFRTQRNGRLKAAMQTWSGDLVNGDTLRLLAPFAGQCGLSTSTTLTFLRSK